MQTHITRKTIDAMKVNDCKIIKAKPINGIVTITITTKTGKKQKKEIKTKSGLLAMCKEQEKGEDVIHIYSIDDEKTIIDGYVSIIEGKICVYENPKSKFTRGKWLSEFMRENFAFDCKDRNIYDSERMFRITIQEIK
jgi:hypothetical protein